MIHEPAPERKKSRPMVMVNHVIAPWLYFTKRNPVTAIRIALIADICSTFMATKIQNNLYSKALLVNYLLLLHEKEINK